MLILFVLHSVQGMLQILVAMCVLTGFSITTASFAIYEVNEHHSGAKRLQHIAGISEPFYWAVNFFYDMVTSSNRRTGDPKHLTNTPLCVEIISEGKRVCYILYLCPMVNFRSLLKRYSDLINNSFFFSFFLSIKCLHVAASRPFFFHRSSIWSLWPWLLQWSQPSRFQHSRSGKIWVPSPCCWCSLGE